ncbi:MAG: hypothetical protein PHU77_01855 [Simplicispira sp.]|nr:hypothetical protein [Simplicispira sp.]
MQNLANLIAGENPNPSHDGDFTLAMKSIFTSLSNHESELKNYWIDAGKTVDVRIFASCSRMLLEQGCAAILGRLDNIRLVSIIKGSSSVDFKLGQRNASSFIWSKDVLPDVKPSGGNYWTQESMNKGIHRSLLEGHLAEYLFSTGHIPVLDKLIQATESINTIPDWIIDIQKKEKGMAVLANIRTMISEAYSTLSKGIHFEFFLGNNTQPNREEIVKATSKAIIALATIAIYTNLTDIGLHKADSDTAISSFISIISEYEYHG